MQSNMNENDINELLNNNNFVQANWNVSSSNVRSSNQGGLRETTFIPTCDDDRKNIPGFDDDEDNYNVEHQNNKKGRQMVTIREELEESKLSNQDSDRPYFQDDDYNSDEEEDLRKR